MRRRCALRAPPLTAAASEIDPISGVPPLVILVTMPTLRQRWISLGGKRAVELWQTQCIVHDPPGKTPRHRPLALVNPANEGLTGTSNFPYFPRGGPVPERPPSGTAHSTSWGGMDAGPNMLFPAHTVDGVVHALGGRELRRLCLQLPDVAPGHQRCPAGSAVCTMPGSAMDDCYEQIIHTTAPFYSARRRHECEMQLLSCYRSAFALAEGRGREPSASALFSFLGLREWRASCTKPQAWSLAVPLLGAGCRAFPCAVAVNVAAEACSEWLGAREAGGRQSDGRDTSKHPVAGTEDAVADTVLMFGIQQENILAKLQAAIAVALPGEKFRGQPHTR